MRSVARQIGLVVVLACAGVWPCATGCGRLGGEASGGNDGGPEAPDCGAQTGLIVLASTEEPANIALSATDVFWAESANLMKVSLCGGSATIVASTSTPDSGPWSQPLLAATSTSVYWTVQGPDDGSVGSTTIMSVPQGGGPQATVAWGGTIGGITADATNLYWTNYAPPPPQPPFPPYNPPSVTTTVMKVPLAGGTPTTLASELNGPGGGPVVTDAANIYWFYAGSVIKTPLAGGTSTTLASTPSGEYSYFTSIAVDATNVYWVNAPQQDPASGPTPNTLLTVPITGGVPVTLASSQGSPFCLAVDGTSAYWPDGEGNVLKVALSGGAPATLASGRGSVHSLAVDSSSIYWSESENCPDGGQCGSVVKLTPK